MKRYGMMLLIAASLLVATPRALEARSDPAFLQPKNLFSPTILSQTPPVGSSSSAELIKILGGSIVGGAVGFIACWKFIEIDLPRIKSEKEEQIAEKERQKVSTNFMIALDENRKFKKDFKDKLKTLFVIEAYEKRQKLFEYCLNASFDELLEDSSPNHKLKRQFKDIINSLSFADRAQIGLNINEIQELRKRVDNLQSRIDEMEQ